MAGVKGRLSEDNLAQTRRSSWRPLLHASDLWASFILDGSHYVPVHINGALRQFSKLCRDAMLDAFNVPCATLSREPTRRTLIQPGPDTQHPKRSEVPSHGTGPRLLSVLHIKPYFTPYRNHTSPASAYVTRGSVIRSETRGQIHTM